MVTEITMRAEPAMIVGVGGVDAAGVVAGGDSAQTNTTTALELVNSNDGTSDDTIEVSVEAEDERDLRFSWKCKLLRTAPIEAMAHHWARAHGVTPEVVGFEDADENLVDVSRTPSELGWSAGNCVKLWAVPMDELFAEGGEEAGASPLPAGRGGRVAIAAPDGAALAAPSVAAASRRRPAPEGQGASQPTGPEEEGRRRSGRPPLTAPQDLSPCYPVLRRFLVQSGLTKTLEAFDKETRDDAPREVAAGAPSRDGPRAEVAGEPRRKRRRAHPVEAGEETAEAPAVVASAGAPQEAREGDASEKDGKEESKERGERKHRKAKKEMGGKDRKRKEADEHDGGEESAKAKASVHLKRGGDGTKVTVAVRKARTPGSRRSQARERSSDAGTRTPMRLLGTSPP